MIVNGASGHRGQLMRVGVWLCGLIAALSLALWAVSSVRGYAVMHRAVSAVPSTNTAWFEVEIQTRQIAVHDGRLVVLSQVHRSGGPDRAILEEILAPQVGWEWRNLGGQTARPPWFLWREDQRIVLGLGVVTATVEGEMIFSAICVPFWLMATAGAVPLVVYFSPGRRRARRRAQGLCAFCGYARNGIASLSACPECGKVDHLSHQGGLAKR